MIKQDFVEAYKNVDVILTPSTPTTAFEINKKDMTPEQEYLNDIYTVPVNLAGLPAVSLPVGYENEGLPIGLQLIGRPFDEETLLRTAFCLEKECGYKRKVA